MEQTANYGLRQWAKTDRIQMEDFNSDNAKIDAALKAHADAIAAAQTALTLRGNCKIKFGTYSGSGTYGSANPTRLTFDGKPLLVIVENQSNTSDFDFHLRLVRGCNWAVGDRANSNYTNDVAWGENYVEWWNDSAKTQFNSGTYSYVALLAADD